MILGKTGNNPSPLRGATTEYFEWFMALNLYKTLKYTTTSSNYADIIIKQSTSILNNIL